MILVMVEKLFDVVSPAATQLLLGFRFLVRDRRNQTCWLLAIRFLLHTIHFPRKMGDAYHIGGIISVVVLTWHYQLSNVPFVGLAHLVKDIRAPSCEHFSQRFLFLDAGASELCFRFVASSKLARSRSATRLERQRR